MAEHKLIIRHPASETPNRALPDGAFTGNGDVTVVLGGSADRIRLHIGKADFWKADGLVYTEHKGGLAPLCTADIFLPHLAYASYEAVQDMDKAGISLSLTDGRLSAMLRVTVCAGSNTILLELERTHPIVSASLSLCPVEGCEAVCEKGKDGDIDYVIRSFDTAGCRFPTHGICTVRCISRRVAEGRERILWAMTVCTNHDSAAYKVQAIERVRSLDADSCRKLKAEHDRWWTQFWSKSGVQLPDSILETYWYAGLYAVACCARNRKFPPGLWGAYATADGMNWFGDYHLNYNYEAAFYALTTCNHTELLEGYMAPLKEYLPIACRFAKEYLGVNGAYFPVGIGPLGLETDYRPDTKEHGHLFLGQKSNASYAAVIPMLHWYGTRDKAFAKREYYDYLLAVAAFWESYLVFEDGAFQSYNDSFHEVSWWSGPDYQPEGHDDKNPIISACLIRMLMKMVIDISQELGENEDKIPRWQKILDHAPAVETFMRQGKPVLRGKADSEQLDELTIECMYPISQIGKYSTQELFRAAENSHRQLAIWDSENRFCSYYPAAARLEYPAGEIVAHLHETIEKRAMPNGMFRFVGGGLENCSAVPNTINEMLLQSYEDIVRIFPVWDRSRDASFHGLRANGAFVVDACLKSGKIRAEIVSEQGRMLTIEAPDVGYSIVTGEGTRIPLCERFTTVKTVPGEHLAVLPD